MNKLMNSDTRIYYPKHEKIKFNKDEKKQLQKLIIKLLKEKNAVIIAHYYTDPDIQELAELSNGCVADSLEMARFGNNHSATTLLVAGVRFMGETAKIINPEKTVLMPTLKAECSLDLTCQEKSFIEFCNAHPERTIVVYANTSAVIKSHSDWVVTSSIALKLIKYLDTLGKKILWAPDKHLGNYIKVKTGADIISWQGSCIVHDEFKAEKLLQMKKVNPEAAILAHPESPQNILDLADVVGSTSQLIHAAYTLPHKKIIVATDKGIFYKMQQKCPEKILLEAPTFGAGATCYSCAHCPWMAMNNLKSIFEGLYSGGTNHEIKIEKNILKKALIPVTRMFTFANQHNLFNDY